MSCGFAYLWCDYNVPPWTKAGMRGGTCAPNLKKILCILDSDFSGVQTFSTPNKVMATYRLPQSFETLLITC